MQQIESAHRHPTQRSSHSCQAPPSTPETPISHTKEQPAQAANHFQHVQVPHGRGHGTPFCAMHCKLCGLLTTSSMFRFRVGGLRGVRASAHSLDARWRAAASAARCASSSAARAASVPSSLGNDVLQVNVTDVAVVLRECYISARCLRCHPLRNVLRLWRPSKLPSVSDVCMLWHQAYPHLPHLAIV